MFPGNDDHEGFSKISLDLIFCKQCHCYKYIFLYKLLNLIVNTC